MRQGPVFLLFAASLLSANAYAEEAAPSPAPVVNEHIQLQGQVDSLEQRLAESERLRTELTAEMQGSAEARETALVSRLRQENQRLKLQLKQAQASQQPPLLTVEQSWFAVGAVVTLVALLCGVLLRGGRKTRREWSN